MIDHAEAGLRLRDARQSRGLTQTEAARRLGMPQPQLSDLERGIKVCSWTRLVEITSILGLDPEILIPEWFHTRSGVDRESP